MEHFRKFEIFQESIFWKLTLSELENKLFSQFSLNQKAILVDFAIFNWDYLLRVQSDNLSWNWIMLENSSNLYEVSRSSYNKYCGNTVEWLHW